MFTIQLFMLQKTMGMNVKLCVLVIVLLHEVYADIYFHNPRLSNTQNNNRGGNNVGPSMAYYAGSTLMLQWTNQHSCGGPNNNCELVIQYMCDDNIRDGNSTTKIPTDNTQCDDNDCNSDQAYGMHENREYYQKCSRRSRNKGLFTADQNINKNSRRFAKNTRQNVKGTRYGYECQEERDYYPYWHPSPWKVNHCQPDIGFMELLCRLRWGRMISAFIVFSTGLTNENIKGYGDIAVMTNDVNRCDYYKTESENVKSREECKITADTGYTMEDFYNGNIVIPNTELLCKSFSVAGYTAQWTEVSSHGLPAPDCRETEPSRDNHNGNGLDGLQNVYNWTIPEDISHDKCVLRIRYNISTNDFDGWTTDASMNTDINLHGEYEFADAEEADTRGYSYEGNPQVQIFGEYPELQFQLAINTAQFGRTFQDRSHMFSIVDRPANTIGKAIHNLNVRGKKGNLVQTYPSTEYDFVPNKINAAVGDFLHVQWTGSDSNPANNAGNGEAKKDRHNLILLSNSSNSRNTETGPEPIYGMSSENYVTSLEERVFANLPKSVGEQFAFPGDTGYFNPGLQQITDVGTYNYVCTKNNDFTNRSQKGKLCVYPYSILYGKIGETGGTIKAADGSVITFDEDKFAKSTDIELYLMDASDGKEWIAEEGGTLNGNNDDFASKILCMKPIVLTDVNTKIGNVSLKRENNNDVNVYKLTGDLSGEPEIDNSAVLEEGFAKFDIYNGGCFYVKEDSSTKRVYSQGTNVRKFSSTSDKRIDKAKRVAFLKRILEILEMEEISR